MLRCSVCGKTAVSTATQCQRCGTLLKKFRSEPRKESKEEARLLQMDIMPFIVGFFLWLFGAAFVNAAFSPARSWPMRGLLAVIAGVLLIAPLLFGRRSIYNATLCFLAMAFGAGGVAMSIGFMHWAVLTTFCMIGAALGVVGWLYQFPSKQFPLRKEGVDSLIVTTGIAFLIFGDVFMPSIGVTFGAALFIFGALHLWRILRPVVYKAIANIP